MSAKPARVAAEPPRRSVKKTERAKTVKVAAAKGRPMLTWVGKRPLRHVTAFPAQHVETFDPSGELDKPRTDERWAGWPASYPKGGLLFHGDNKEVLAHLLATGFRGKVDLVYIDPPFDSGADYVRRVSLRGPSGTVKIEGEGYTLGEQLQYTDIWTNDQYLQFIYERLLLLKELLQSDGAIYVHLNTSRSAHGRVLLDEVFGSERFRNEVVWQRTTAHSDTRGRFAEVHDVILGYAKGDSPSWTPEFLPYSDNYRESKYNLAEEDSGRIYRLGDLTAPGPRPNLEYEWQGIRPPAGRCWAVPKVRMQHYEDEGRLVYSRSGMPQYKRYLDEMQGTPIHDVWTDIPPVNPMAGERLGFPTQKPENLLGRLIRTSTQPGALVLDAFVGSGTSAVVAQQLGRRWIGCDINRGAIQTAAKRIQDVIDLQRATGTQGKLDDEQVEQAQLAFTTWRVNDYDLAVHQEEMARLASEHLGVQRTRTDLYFDGTLGRSLVKIIPFHHPLSPMDLERLKEELDARPNEDRAVSVVCLGIELAAQKWIDDWNKRPGRRSVNRIDAIELRSDPRYGGLIRHDQATARVRIARSKDAVTVAVTDFLSPSIIQRLAQQTGVVKPKIDDWRQMVDCVMIDTVYDGEIFNVVLSDVPAKKNDFVEGRYTLPAPKKKKTTVAVKIVDMLGEEVVVTADV